MITRKRIPLMEGDVVRLRRGVHAGVCPEGRQNHRTARIDALFTSETYAGGLRTERDLRGCRYWHTSDVELVP